MPSYTLIVRGFNIFRPVYNQLKSVYILCSGVGVFCESLYTKVKNYLPKDLVLSVKTYTYTKNLFSFSTNKYTSYSIKLHLLFYGLYTSSTAPIITKTNLNI